MMPIFVRAAVLFALTLPFAARAQVVTVFGLPLGGPLPKLPICRSSDDSVPASCRVTSGERMAGSMAAKSATVRIPAASAPVWAGVTPTLHLDLDGGLIASLKIDAFYVDPRTVNASLGKRFGLPDSHLATAEAVNDQWHRPDLDIDMFCIREDLHARCTVTFRSAAAAAARRIELAERDRRAAQRPASP